MKKTLRLKHQTLRILSTKRLTLVAGGRIDLSDIAGGCETNHCPPGPADDDNG